MKRLDVILVEKGIYVSREKAKQAIESGRVEVDGRVVSKPAMLCDEKSVFKGLPFEFVSRGGFKLQKALEEFKINLSDKVVLDVGASTGGFTDVCLKNGAKKVYAVDTGEGQLSEKLRKDARVLNMEKTNFLTISKDKFFEVEFVCVDVSFVSLTKLVPKFAEVFLHSERQIKEQNDEKGNDCKTTANVESNMRGVDTHNESVNTDDECVDAKRRVVDIVALIKPQFECGLEYARKHHGVVKDEKVRQKAIKNVVDAFCMAGFIENGLINSPIKGGDGNVEYLVWFSNVKHKHHSIIQNEC